MSLIQDILHIARYGGKPITKPQMIVELLTLQEYTDANLNKKNVSDFLSRLVNQGKLVRIGKLFCATGGGTLVSVIQLLTDKLEARGNITVYGTMCIHERYIDLD